MQPYIIIIYTLILNPFKINMASSPPPTRLPPSIIKKAINDTAILQNLNLTKTNSFQTHTNRRAILQLQPTNLAVHNLCTTTQPPSGTKNLLGLGLKFCTSPRTSPTDLKECMHKLEYSIRNRQYIIENNHNKRCEYISQLYIKVHNWQPPPATNTIENELTNFEKTMERAIENHKDKNKNKNK